MSKPATRTTKYCDLSSETLLQILVADRDTDKIVFDNCEHTDDVIDIGDSKSPYISKLKFIFHQADPETYSRIFGLFHGKTRLQSVTIYCLSIHEIVAIALCKIYSLRRVHLGYQRISTGAISTFVNASTNLQKLILEHLKLSPEMMKTLASNHRTLIKLELDLCSFHPDSLYAFSQNTSLCSLSLNKADRELIPPLNSLIKNNKTLRTLRLAYTIIDESTVESLSQNTSLTKLHLSNVVNRSIPNFFYKIIQSPNLRSICLRECFIQNSDICSSELSLNTTLTYLDLGCNYIENSGAECIAKLPSLTRLIVTKNKISDHGYLALTCNTKLVGLQLKNNPVHCAITSNTSLTSLDLSGCPLEILPNISTLKSLTISHTNVTESELLELLEKVTLESLDISSLNISNRIILALCSNTTLRTLKLTSNDFDAYNQNIISFILAGTLHTLDYAFLGNTPHYVDDITISEPIADALESNYSITDFKVHYINDRFETYIFRNRVNFKRKLASLSSIMMEELGYF